MSFEQRAIDVTITPGIGQDGATAGDPITLTGKRVLAHIASVGGPTQGAASVRIFGMTLEMMNQLTAIATITNTIPYANEIVIAAGDKGDALNTVYSGGIAMSWADFSVPAEPALVVSAVTAINVALKPVPPQSFPGTTDAAVIMAQLAATAGWRFENNGVQVQLRDQYLPGTTLDQIKRVATAAHIRYSTDLGTLSIWPWDGFREGVIPLISKDTGMVGYPVYTGNGVIVRSRFLPGITMGGQVQIQSSLTPACGIWLVKSVVHDLESEQPDGAWFTTVETMTAPRG